MSINSKFILPFKVKFGSEVTGGYADELHSKYYPNTEISNYHEDTIYIDNEENVYTAILQSPFTERWVGGRQYRHINYNTGSDSSENRPEGFHIDLQPQSIRLYSHAFRNSPPAYWTRDGRTKRPVNISNIAYDGRTEGNYRENYEFIQTSGRRINNSLVVDGFEPINQFKTLFITSSLNQDYELTDLLSQTGSKSVIVERFNAPGSKEESSRGSLDRESEEYSPNIPLPFRNIKIRQPFYRQLAQHNPQFGSGSTYALLPETGTVQAVTIHKINRNRLPGTGPIKDSFDNGFVTHQIPRTDIQYSWITASAVTTAAQLRGFQSYRTSTYSRRPGFDDITFMSSSLVTSGSNEKYEIDNHYLNSLSKNTKQIDIDTNTFSMSASLSASYSEIVNSNYGFPIWESLRLSDTPVVRNLRKENILSLLDVSERVVFANGVVDQRRAETSTNYYEPAVTFKYKPLEYGLRIEGSRYNLKTDYTNILSTFANKDLIERNKLPSEIRETTETFYDYLREEYKKPDGRISYIEHRYSEIIWPKEERTGLSQTRKREAYYLNKSGFDRDGYDRQLGTQRVFWRDSQEDRRRSDNSSGGYYSSMGYLSTEENGSLTSFSTDDEIRNIQNEVYEYTSSYSKESEIYSFNSISMIEPKSNEDIQYSSSTAFYSKVITNSLLEKQEVASYFRQTKSQNVLGESNEKFTDFFGYNGFSGSLTSSYYDFGTFYRNSVYKNIFITREAGVDMRTEGDTLTINPKTRYLSFVGGAETNDDNTFQSTLFTNEILNSNIYEQTINSADIKFSTMDNGLLRTTEEDSGKTPFFDSYEQYLQEIYPLTKDHSQIPEFRISEHMEDYINTPGGFGRDFSIFRIDGIDATDYKSGNSRLEKNSTFIKNYLTSDLLKKSKKIEEENSDISQLDNINIKVSGIKKLLPYNGFYPQDRTLQLANLYKEFIDNNLEGGLYKTKYTIPGEERSYPYLKTFISSYDQIIDSPSFTDEAYRPGMVNTIASTEDDDYIYIAWGMSRAIHVSASEQGTIAITKFPKDDDPYSTTSLTYPPTFIKANTTYNTLGAGTMRFLRVGSDVLLFYTMVEQPSYNSVIAFSRASNNFSTITPISTSSNYTYGQAFDCIYDENNSKIILAIGDPGIAINSAGDIQIWTSTNDGATWTLEATISNIILGQKLGTSISLLSSSATSYNLYASAPSNHPSATDAEIALFRSTDASTWGIYKNLFTGGSGTNNTFPGYGGLKAIENDNGRVYLFWNEIDYPNPAGIFPYTPDGAFFGAYTDDDWATNTKQLLYQGDSERFPVNKGGGSTGVNDLLFTNVIDATIKNGKVHYFVGANQHDKRLPGKVTLTNAGSFAYGIFDEATNTFQTKKNMYVEEGDAFAEMYGGAGAFINGSSQQDIHLVYSKLTSFNITNKYKAIEYSIDVESDEAQKAKTMAGIEPLFAPGIIYNTIKSGIAVDWPCSTGSISFIVSEDETVYSNYFPKPFSMFQLETDIGNHAYILNARGNLKSEVNYRVPFESLFDQKEIFETKEQTITRNTSFSFPAPFVPTDLSINNLLDKCYVYGGYETYSDPTDVEAIFDLPPQKFSIPFVYRKNNYSDNGLFTMAINNFFAETVNFFLEEGKLVTFESSPDNEWGEFKQGKTYYMDVRLEKSAELVMMEAWHSDVHPTGSNNEKMNGRYFGYPVNKTTKNIRTEEFTEEESRLIHNDPAYAPYTPPYFEGTAIARISFSPTTTGRYTLTEILDNMEIENIFVEASNSWADGSDAQVHKMPVEASVDLRGISKVVRSEIRQSGQVTNSTVLTELPENKKWVISSRMETPVLDFSDQESVAYSSNYIKKSGYGRGMWSGYGKLPSSGSGISLEISYPFGRDFVNPYSRANDKLSLLKQIGFKAETKKVGQIRKNGKQIKEAVVLIPYLENPNAANRKSYTTGQNFFENLFFMKIDKREYSKQKRKIESGENPTDTKESTSISRMLESMKDYVIPPYLDFLNDSSIKPFVMYLFEFEHQLSQQDLVDIWQGLMPDISYNAETEEVEISHPSAEDEFFHGKTLPENLKWMVFRVKQKAIYDFGKITSSTKDDQRFAQNTVVGREGLPYSYNWPYDYCSLVEFAKVELELNYKKKQE